MKPGAFELRVLTELNLYSLPPWPCPPPPPPPPPPCAARAAVWKISVSACGITPGASAGPCIVYVFPLPVCPYAKMTPLYPASADRAVGFRV